MSQTVKVDHSQSAAVISLTAQGAELADRLVKLGAAIQHQHKPKPFADAVQTLFKSSTPLILICATGIAVRTLAPVLQDKYHDPAVLVLDEDGQFVIPLLSGHEGGANEWSRQIAEQLNAQHVITSAQNYLKPSYVIGMGCERHCPKSVLKGLLVETLAKADLTIKHVSAIASIDVKADEVGLIELANELNIPFLTYPAVTLRKVEDQLSYKSEIVFKEVGCYGVAEAAALICASHSVTVNGVTANDAELLVPKHKNKQATCAVARCYKS